ncbi:hypothetical protein KSP40_PGU006236 [Platanthera guangdongensis]|uniref:Uncharacterized protein n=1 Tax=Platanthera guangdongensis TaxID=2320717 RepID=A0ABR2LXQ8_9ASPA
MSPHQFFFCQHVTQSSLGYKQDFVGEDKMEEKELMASSSTCSSSSSSNLLAGKAEEMMMEAIDADQNGGYCTPASPDSRIPAMVQCPPPPKKPMSCRRRLMRLCSEGRRFEFVEGLGLVVFMERRCLRRKGRRAVRRSLAIAK